MKHTVRLCVLGVLALALTAGGFCFYGIGFRDHALLYYLASYGVFGLVKRAAAVREKRLLLSGAAFSLVLTAAFVFGSRVDLEEKPFFSSMGLLDWALVPLLGGLIYVCVLALVDWILRRRIPFSLAGQRVSRGYWAKAFALLVICWMPYFLVFYPGNISRDSLLCIRQAIGDAAYGYNHPPAFSACVGVFMKLGMLIGDINFGISCYTMAQLLVFALILSYVLYWLRCKGAPSWVVLLCGGFFALDPMIATFAVTMWKDILFSAFLLLLMTWLFDVAESDGQVLARKQHLAMLAIMALFLSLWRNSMAAGVCVLTAVLAVCYRKYIRYFLPVCVAVLCVVFAVLGPVYDSLDIPETNKAESHGILLQQVGYTLEQGGEIDGESRAFLDRILPTDIWADTYAPGGSDPVKFHEEFDNEFFDSHIDEFKQVWWKLLPDNWQYYLKAWLMNTIGYFDPDTTATQYWVGIIPEDKAPELGIYRTDLIDEVTGVDLVGRVIEAFLFFAKKLPVFTSVYNIAFSVWLFFLGVLVAVLRKRHTRTHLWAMLPLGMLWLTIMLTTPVCCEFRYMFLFHLAIPLVMVLMFREQTAEG